MGGNDLNFWIGLFGYALQWGGLGLVVLGLLAIVVGFALEWVAS